MFPAKQPDENWALLPATVEKSVVAIPRILMMPDVDGFVEVGYAAWILHNRPEYPWYPDTHPNSLSEYW